MFKDFSNEDIVKILVSDGSFGYTANSVAYSGITLASAKSIYRHLLAPVVIQSRGDIQFYICREENNADITQYFGILAAEHSDLPFI